MAPFKVVVHPLTSEPTDSSHSPSLTAYESEPFSSPNALVFIHGLTAGPHTTDLTHLQAALPSEYSIWELRMRSSYSGWGYSSLDNDVQDLTRLVRYLREDLKIKRIVLMGASTGCQGALEYNNHSSQPPRVDGYILTSPVSDREAANTLWSSEALAESLAVAKELIDQGKECVTMPKKHVPFLQRQSRRRDGGALLPLDYFASDISDEVLADKFGRVNKPLLILPAEKDEMVPASVDKQLLLERWSTAAPKGVVSELSGFIPDADHVVSSSEAQKWLAERVAKFLSSI
ncbi:uncharacterized protein QC761_0000140 [Podospora bellae-mahoneyi]|uniref:AB hydrolase-1 domain-containing protein n=1 Tax=Podospora bellae-mahoneyi TaxID=2093777 RepID=A0ABR0FWN1_9PEZI|nr:hypothetical protein QC761_0000140 [Podospora bellae-mahoneyi]